MTRPAHDRGAHSSPRRRASWMPTRSRVLVPPARPGEPAVPDQPGPAPAPARVDVDQPPAFAPPAQPAPAQPAPAEPGPDRVSDTPAPGHSESISSSEPHTGPITVTRETVHAPAVVPPDAPGRRSIVARWHLLRLGVLVVVALVIGVSITD